MNAKPEARRAFRTGAASAAGTSGPDPRIVSAATPRAGHDPLVAGQPVGAASPVSTAPTGTRSWTIALPAGTELLNSNQRSGHWGKRQRISLTLRHAAKQLAEQARIPACHRVHITGYYRPLTRRRYDPPNFYPSFKAAIDGLVDAGVVPDDSAAYVEGPDMRPGELLSATPAQRKLWRHGQLVIVITDLGVEAVAE